MSWNKEQLSVNEELAANVKGFSVLGPEMRLSLINIVLEDRSLGAPPQKDVKPPPLMIPQRAASLMRGSEDV